MEVLVLRYRGEPLREFPLGSRPLEVGSGAGCDIVVHDARVRERHLLVSAIGGSVMLHELRPGGKRAPLRALELGFPVRIGLHHSIERVRSERVRLGPATSRTEPLGVELGSAAEISLLVGSGTEARRIPLDALPLTIGSGSRNDVVIHDRTVSGRHCRLEPSADGLWLRDLGSRNGTHVDGVAIELARVLPGSVIRVGRTNLRLVSRGRPGDAREDGLVAESPKMRAVLELVERYAQVRETVLIHGESGAGKEGIARALHSRGPRASGPFVAVNAGGMTSTLVESTLFGHERGAFTGAAASRRGLFEQADGGTLFLDEIGELPLEMQKRLLRVLDSWEVRRVGAEHSQKVDVRLLCATHRDLRAMVREGTFRDDLYWRVAQLEVRVPPLRERAKDVMALAEHFLAQSAEGGRRLSAEAVQLLLTHDWPGNARELRNVMGRCANRATGSLIALSDVEAVFDEMGVETRSSGVWAIEEVVDQYGGNLTAAARALGIPRSTLRDRYRRAQRRRRAKERKLG